MSEHTKREWTTRDGRLCIVDSRLKDGWVRPLNAEDAEYAAIALNALEGIPTKALEAGAIKRLVEAASIEKLEKYQGADYMTPVGCDALEELRLALAALKPESED